MQREKKRREKKKNCTNRVTDSDTGLEVYYPLDCTDVD